MAEKTEREKNKETEELKQIIVDNIIENYIHMEESIVSQLQLYNRAHGSTTGTSREDVWLQLFEKTIPKKYVIEHSIMIIDSHKNVSREVDLAIVDNSYTPYIFQHGRLKFIPIEAVAAVIECKSTSIGDLGTEKENTWLDKIKSLKTSEESIARLATGIVVDGKSYTNGNVDQQGRSSTQSSTRPIRIFCGFESRNKQKVLKQNFDIILNAHVKEKKIDLWINSDKYDSLMKWYLELNHYGKPVNALKETQMGSILEKENGVIRDLKDYHIIHNGREVTLMSFNFILNQLLMLINNPILFPHRAYARMFNDENSKGGQEKHADEEG